MSTEGSPSMHRSRIRAALCVLAAAPALLALTGPAAAGTRQHAVCSAAPPGYASCLSIVVQQQRSKAAAPGGLNPADLQNAYKLPSSTAGAGRTVAIVDAFDDPNAESDLSHYRAQFGLPACTTANGCFRKVNQRGTSTPPAADVGWAEEISLDLDMVSAACPNCHILLVETDNNSFANLAAGVDRAAAMGAVAISNSYGGSEYSAETSDQSHYNHPGIAVTVSSGDNGFGVEFPAASQYVTAVGGTALRRASGTTRGWSETAWSGAGSGCSRYVTKPSWQHDTGCARRTVADVSAVASPSTGVSVYDTYGGVGGWLVFGGTSASAPLIASVYALAGNTGSITYGSYPYSHTASLFDVTSGNNGSCSTSARYLCTAGTGYDGPTGLGTPNGTGAF
jgi:subtilase family serine protease